MFKTILIVLLLLPSSWAIADISVVVHPDNGTTSLTMKEVKKIYLGRMRSFPAGGPIAAFDQNEGSKTRNSFYKIVVKKQTAQLNAYWSIQIFSGKAVPPKIIGSDSDIIAKIKNEKNAIGYIDSKNLTSDVKEVLRIK